MIRLSSLLAPERIFDLKGKDKEAVLREMMDAVCSSKHVSDAQAYRRAILEREKVMSTAIGEGIAIPHAKVTCVRQPVLALGRSVQGVAFDAPDQGRVHLVVMIAAPEKETGVYLQILSKVIALLVRDPIKQALLNARDGKAILDTIASHD